ncbi:MAG: YiiD C-terminal domain-containing protein [bacterium]|nr:YiiD C-terminal domain-containing protein [bacterium]
MAEVDEKYQWLIEQFDQMMIPVVRSSGFAVEKLKEREITVSMPMGPNTNHVGIMYAGSLFTLIEVAGGVLFSATYPAGVYTLITKGISIRYVKPSMTKTYCHLTISKEEAEAKIKPVDERGRGNWIIDVTAVDENEVEVCRANCNYYALTNKELGKMSL